MRFWPAIFIVFSLTSELLAKKDPTIGYIKVDWPSVEGAKLYELIIEKEVDGKFVEFKPSLIALGNSWQGALPIGTYQVKYRAKMGKDKFGEWSNPTQHSTQVPFVETRDPLPLWDKATEEKVPIVFRWKKSLHLKSYRLQLRRQGGKRFKTYITKKNRRRIRLRRDVNYEWRVLPNMTMKQKDKKSVQWQAIYYDEHTIDESDIPPTEAYLTLTYGGGPENLKSIGFIGSTDGSGATTTSKLELDMLPEPEQSMMHFVLGARYSSYETVSAEEISSTDEAGNVTTTSSTNNLVNNRYGGYLVVRSRTNLSRSFYGLGGIVVSQQIPVIVPLDEDAGRGKLGVQNVNGVGVSAHYQTPFMGGDYYLDFNLVPIGSGTRYFYYSNLLSHLRWTWGMFGVHLGGEVLSLVTRTTQSCANNQASTCSYSRTTQFYLGGELGVVARF